MRAKRLPTALAVLVLAAAAANADSEPLSKRQLLEVRPSSGAERILEQLQDLLILPDRYDGPRPHNLLEDRFYQLKPHGTGISGLCESATIVFHFDPLRLDDENADTPTRLTSVDVKWPEFRFRDLPRTADERMSKAERASLNANCRGEGYSWEKYFSADSAEQAFEGAWLLQALKAQVLPQGKGIDCKPDELKACVQTLNLVVKGDPPDVRACEASDQKANLWCLQIGDISQIARAYYHLHGPDIQIDHVAIYEQVVLWHPRPE